MGPPDRGEAQTVRCDYTAAVDAPAQPERPRSRRLLLIIGGLVVALCVAFGVTVLRQKARFEAYRAATLDDKTMPWEQAELSIDECVAFTVDWAMGCTGVESWCSGHAPRLTLECLRSADRTQACTALGDLAGDTHFGYAECERLRESVDGRYAKRNHKKFCAASYRAVAELCRDAP